MLWLIEHVARELDPAAAVLTRLRERDPDINVVIASLPVDGVDAVMMHEPDVIVVPYLSGRDDAHIDDVIRAIVRPTCVVNASFEHVLFRANEDRKRPRDDMAREQVVQIAASNTHRNRLRRQGVPEDNIALVGSIYHAALSTKSHDGAATSALRESFARASSLDPQSRWLLVPENWAAAFFGDARINAMAERGFPDAYGYRTLARETMDASLRWLARIATASEWTVIVRPRPSTPERCMRDAVNRALGGSPPSRLHVIKRGIVADWIIASDHVASSWSTTLIDAALLDRPATMMMPRELPSWLHADWYEHTPTATTFEALHAALDEQDSTAAASLRAWARDTLTPAGDPINGMAALLHRCCADVGPRVQPSSNTGRRNARQVSVDPADVLTPAMIDAALARPSSRILS